MVFGRTPLGELAIYKMVGSMLANYGSVPDRKVTAEIALQILACREYYPLKPSLLRPFKEQSQEHNDEIEEFLLEVFDIYCDTSGQLLIVMFWAVFNGALKLVRKCISHDRSVLCWQQDEIDLIHLASYSGLCDTVKLLLEEKTQYITYHERLWEQLTFIVKEDSRGNSPLSIAIKNGHIQLEEIYWKHFRQLHKVQPDFVNLRVATRDRILETLARFEMPGHEVILRECLEQWFRQPDLGPKFTTLKLAIACSQPIVVWWLLSNGGYSAEAMESAKSLVAGEYAHNSPCLLIQQLLKQPPPVLDHVVNFNKQHHFSPSELDAIPASQDQVGTIIDIQYDGELINFPHVKKNIKEIIYGHGPDFLMSNMNSKDWRQYGLHALKATLGETNSDSFYSSVSSHGETRVEANTQLQTPGGESCSLKANTNLLRWIHLPTNDVITTSHLTIESSAN